MIGERGKWKNGKRKIKFVLLPVVNIIESNIDKIRLLCLRYKVSKLFVFGSVLKSSFTAESDIDLIVDFNQIDINEYADNYFDLKDQLESLFQRPVDLLEEKGIRNPFLRAEIGAQKQLVYG